MRDNCPYKNRCTDCTPSVLVPYGMCESYNTFQREAKEARRALDQACKSGMIAHELTSQKLEENLVLEGKLVEDLGR